MRPDRGLRFCFIACMVLVMGSQGSLDLGLTLEKHFSSHSLTCVCFGSFQVCKHPLVWKGCAGSLSSIQAPGVLLPSKLQSHKSNWCCGGVQSCLSEIAQLPKTFKGLQHRLPVHKNGLPHGKDLRCVQAVNTHLQSKSWPAIYPLLNWFYWNKFSPDFSQQLTF